MTFRRWSLFLVLCLNLVGWKSGDKADIKWNDGWFKGLVKSADSANPQKFCISYEGYDASWDECGVGSDRLAPYGSKAKEAPVAAPPSSGGYQYDYCGGKPKSSCRSGQGCEWRDGKCVANKK